MTGIEQGPVSNELLRSVKAQRAVQIDLADANGGGTHDALAAAGEPQAASGVLVLAPRGIRPLPIRPGGYVAGVSSEVPGVRRQRSSAMRIEG